MPQSTFQACFGTKKVNLQIEKSTADKLNRLVEDTNMVRDTFINRLLLFLRSTAPVLKRLGLPEFHTNSLYKEWLDPLPISPLGAMEAIHADPFYYLRFHIEKQYETGLYLQPLPRQLIGFACYLEEFEVPGTEAYKKAQVFADNMLDEIFSKSDVPTDTQKKGGAS